MTGPAPHRLWELLAAAAEGRFPPVDGGVEVVAPERVGHHALVEFTGHSVVVTDREPSDPLFDAVDGFGATGHPDFVSAMAAGRQVGTHDAVLVRYGGRGTEPELPETDRFDEHPRVVRAREHRRDVAVFGDDSGLVTLGRGLVGRAEISVELVGVGHALGAGRRLIRAGLARVEPEQPVFAQVAPGNAASLRAFLAVGFVPIGSEILIGPH